jgi:thiamine-phosphate pyrophosphorylase
VELVAAWTRGGVDVVQLRHKSLRRAALLELACRLAPVCRREGILFIVNDHVDVAMASAADGVHLGPHDLTVAGARRAAGPDLLIGASASSPEAAVRAEAEGADYLGSGPAFPTPLKPEKGVIGPAGVAAVASAVRIPVFAIGGIDIDNLEQLKAHGVTRVCAIRALADPVDGGWRAKAFREALAR